MYCKLPRSNSFLENIKNIPILYRNTLTQVFLAPKNKCLPVPAASSNWRNYFKSTLPTRHPDYVDLSVDTPNTDLSLSYHCSPDITSTSPRRCFVLCEHPFFSKCSIPSRFSPRRGHLPKYGLQLTLRASLTKLWSSPLTSQMLSTKSCTLRHQWLFVYLQI